MEKLSRLTLKNSLLCFKIASFLKSIPFHLCNRNRLKVELFQSIWRIALWYLVNTLVLCNSSYQILSFVWNVHVQGLTSETAVHMPYVCIASLAILYFVPLLLNREAAARLIDQLDFVLEMSQRQFPDQKRWHAVPFVVLVVNYLIFFFYAGLTSALTLIFAINPNKSMYVFSILPPAWKSQPGIFPVFLAYEAMMVLWILSILSVYFVYWCASVFQNIIWLNDLAEKVSTVGDNGQEMLSSESDQFQQLFKFFTQLRILNVFHNEFNRHFSSGFTGIFSFCTILLIYGSLEAFHLVPIYIYLIFPCGACFAVVLTAIFWPYIYSQELKSVQFLSDLDARVRRSEGLFKHEQMELLKQVQAAIPLRNQLSYFGNTSLGVSKGCIDEIFNEVLLLLSY